MPIRRLPTLVVNQIAAGEVIERPASVVKELVENAIDAGAGCIGVAIERGGRDLIAVTDDGAGIPFDELELAVAPHATSKISSTEDLDCIGTMGFRGEALASIASIARVSIVSRCRGEDAAGLLEIEAGEMAVPRPHGGPPGTRVTARNLFFNTPARRKFLRTDATEARRVSQVMETLAIAHPAIAFTLDIDGRRRLDLAAGDSARARVLAVLGPEMEIELLPLDASSGGIDFWGLIGTPAVARGTARHVRVFLNGRAIVDRTINHAVREAYRGLIAPDQHPTVVLMLQIDPSRVDVNVHPAKAEVRFRDQSAVHRAVVDVIRAALAAGDLAPAFDLDRTGGGASFVEPRPMPVEPVAPAARAGRIVNDFRQLDPARKGFVYSELRAALEQDEPDLLRGAATVADTPMPAVRVAADALQIHSSYIVTEDDQGLVIIDQHALHERVMFEKLKRRITADRLESQRLLVPATFDVDASLVDRIETLRPLLDRLGIDAEPIGPSSIAVHAFTSLLLERNVEPAAFVADLLTRLGDDDDEEAALHEVLDMMACKAAVKAGDRLTEREIAELVAHAGAGERSSRCPHGRPTTLRVTIADLERQFGRR